MNNYYEKYCALISSAEQLEYCQQAPSLTALLAAIKKIWHCAELTDEQLLGELAQLNQTPIPANDIQLAGIWLPYRYQPKNRTVNWLLPVGHATEPFQDEYISRCRQKLLNQIIQPCTSLDVAQQQAENLADIQPAGFIFHLSRCGSTLISGCLSELDTTCVFSESPLLTELILDGKLSPIEQQGYLRSFINLQASVFPNRPQVIIKWNAWDIFRWELIREIYPQVPAIFLVRDPVEILASHQRSVGRHMSGDPALGYLDPVFLVQSADSGLFQWRIRILGGLLQEMRKKLLGQKTILVDYRQLSASNLVSIMAFVGSAVDELGFLKIQARMQFHSKTSKQVFVADSAKKQLSISADERENIHVHLVPVYNQLMQFAHKPLGAVINVC